MKSVILSTLLTSVVVAFAPSQQTTSRTSSSSLNEFVKGYVGGEGPEPMFIGATGSKNFDPLGLSTVSENLTVSLVLSISCIRMSVFLFFCYEIVYIVFFFHEFEYLNL